MNASPRRRSSIGERVADETSPKSGSSVWAEGDTPAPGCDGEHARDQRGPDSKADGGVARRVQGESGYRRHSRSLAESLAMRLDGRGTRG